MYTVNIQWEHCSCRMHFNAGAGPLRGIFTVSVLSSTLGAAENRGCSRPELPSATLGEQHHPSASPKMFTLLYSITHCPILERAARGSIFSAKIGNALSIYLTRKLNVLLNPYYQNTVQKFKESSFSFYSSRNPLKPKL